MNPTDMNLSTCLPDVPEEYRQLLAQAFKMAENAGAIHMKHYREAGLEQSTKLNDSDVVTIADKESEAFILDYIRRNFPTHGVIAEESGRKNDDREWCWVIDPLDGTTNFSAGLPAFCVSIALEHNHEAVLGVVFAPYLRECFCGVKGAGAWMNGRPIHCSTKQELSKAVVATGMPYDRNDNPDNNLRQISEVALKVRAVRLMGSAAIDLCYTAVGFFDAYWELNLRRWDVAAGQLIAREAGCLVETIRRDRNHSLLVSNPQLHQSMRGLLI